MAVKQNPLELFELWICIYTDDFQLTVETLLRSIGISSPVSGSLALEKLKAQIRFVTLISCT